MNRLHPSGPNTSLSCGPMLWGNIDALTMALTCCWASSACCIDCWYMATCCCCCWASKFMEDGNADRELDASEAEPVAGIADAFVALETLAGKAAAKEAAVEGSSAVLCCPPDDGCADVIGDDCDCWVSPLNWK